MTRHSPILTLPLCVSLLAVAFCVWTAFGNDVNLCVTTGCALYHDFSVAGVSLWWIGAAAFSLLCACALFGLIQIGKILAAVFLFGDACLLALMSVTSPCVSCLVAAFLFAAAYLSFRYSYSSTLQGRATSSPRWGNLILKRFWDIFFIINVGLVLRSQLGVWPILEDGDARIKMFFSLSCPRCEESINAVSGRVDIAYYPIADNDADVFKIARLKELIDEGENIAEAVAQTRDVEAGGLMSFLDPQILLLRFRLLRNKAYVLSAGSQGVPFFEYLGVPPDIMAKIKARKAEKNGGAQASSAPSSGGSDALPPEIMDSGQCFGNQPCPPVN